MNRNDSEPRPRVLFCGTPDFAVPSLRALLDSPYCPILVVTQPDRPRGRGQRVSPSPVKQAALEAGLPVLQPERFNSEETLARIREARPDLAVVVAYSAKIGKRALEMVPEGWLNLHPSLLPAYRGAAPLQWALIRGETRTGVSTFFLNEAWDAGPICLQEELAIRPEEDYGTLSARAAEVGAALILRSVEAVAEGVAPRGPQDDSRATFAPLLKPEDSRLAWESSASDIHNRARGLSPQPGLFARWGGKLLRVEKTGLLAEQGTGAAPGQVLRADKGGLVVQTGHGAIELLRVRPESKGSMSGRDFVNGARLKPGDFLENGPP